MPESSPLKRNVKTLKGIYIIITYYDDVYINITVDQTGILFHQVISIGPTGFFEITNIGLVVFLLSISLP